jgi:periplasmic divalent cation tolerance protein
VPTLYVTAPPEAAAALARGAVEERLAACVNRVPCRSTYRWEGAVVDDEEEILLLKTTDDRYGALRSYLEREHPYDVPCIERFDEADVLDAFGAWVVDSTSEE